MSFLKIPVIFCIVFLLGGREGNLVSSASDKTRDEARNSSRHTGNQDDTENRENYLRFISEMRDQSSTSGGRVQFKCRVESWPNDHMVYTWYKDNMAFAEEEDNNRVTIRNRPTGSKLVIKDLTTLDSGEYRCEVSNGLMRTFTTATLKVSFKLPPLDDHVTKIPQGKCEEYKGESCSSLLAGKRIYVDPFLPLPKMEQEITKALNRIQNTDYMSPKCKHYAFPAFCNFVFSPCEYQIDSESGKKKAVPVKLCREDCELMKYDVCKNEYQSNKDDKFLQEIFSTANCSLLPRTTSRGTNCTKIDLPSISERSQICYSDTGTSYKGVISRSKTGKQCQPWPKDMVIQYKELAGGHNFCRNPGDRMDMPWCYTDKNLKKKEVCNIKKCVLSSKNNYLMVILVPSVAIPLVLVCICLFLFFCRWKNSRAKKGTAKEATKPIVMSALTPTKSHLPNLNASFVHLLGEIGDSVYGKVYKAQVLSNPLFCTKFPVVRKKFQLTLYSICLSKDLTEDIARCFDLVLTVAVKSLRNDIAVTQAKEFQRELDVFSELLHENVACLKAIVIQPTLRCMIFEYTDTGDLQEYLVAHSPNADFANVASSGCSQASSTIDETEFIQMAVQIASGMEYLSSNNYIHRDLAARNILLCGNELKISNLGHVRESHISCYYRSPQGGQMLPIRWMAPESLRSWQFSDKSTVWSFAVLLWEMFSYGMQPYCGYSNHEVLDMISRRQLLCCPDQCPAKIYSLMHECWAEQAVQRPSFKDLRAKLRGWDGSNTGRLTSHLAQGIHRQLAAVNRDGAVQYNRFYQTSSIGGSSGITYTSAVGPTPSPPPPQYSHVSPFHPSVSTFPKPNDSTNIHSTSHQLPPSTATSCYQSSGQQCNLPPPPNHFYDGNQEQTQYPASKDYIHQQRRGNFYRKGPASHSSRSSSSCASSGREQYAPIQPRRYVARDNSHYQDGTSPPPFSGPGNRPLNGVIENECDTDHREQYHSQYAPLMHSRPSQLRDPSVALVQNNKNHANGDKNDPSDISNESAKAASCDSGLPVEDADPSTIDSSAPLLNQPQYSPSKLPAHLASQQKLT